MENPTWAKTDLSSLHSGHKCLLYFDTISQPYRRLRDADSLHFCLRCVLPKWRDPGRQKRDYHVQYFPLDQTYEMARYVKAYRDEFDIFNSILPVSFPLSKGGNYPSNEDFRYYGLLAVEIDGEGFQGTPDGTSAVQAAIDHFMVAHRQKGVPKPHMAVQSRRGYHLYTLLDKTYKMDSQEHGAIYTRTLKRLCIWISGEPDGSWMGQPAFSGPHADSGPTYRAATLRPVGSYNHKVKDSPVEMRLVHHDLSLDRYSRIKWTTELLPPLLDPAPMPLHVAKEGGLPERKPYQRWRMRKETEQFLLDGHVGPGFHERIKRATSDMQWAGYTQEETCERLERICKTETQLKEVRDFVYKGARAYWNWNTTEAD